MIDCMYTEGKAKIDGKDAFFNTHSRFSRDISIAILSKETQDKEITFLDSTAATGIRGIRCFKELGMRNIVSLDINESAYKSIISNIKLNEIYDGIKAVNEDIRVFANTINRKFDVVDFDPFGTPAPNLYDILKIVNNGGLLMVSATDTAVLCGAQMKACLKVYGSVSIHNELCHEVGLRILIGYISGIAAQFNFGIEIEFSLVHRHFMRIVVRFRKGADYAYASLKKLGFVGHCKKCGYIHYNKGFIITKTKCDECSEPLVYGGRLWLGKLYEKDTKEYVYNYFKREKFDFLDVVTMIKGEIDSPFYFHLPSLTRSMHTASVSPIFVVNKLLDLGFCASLTHIHRESIKTDADIGTIKKCISSAFDKFC